MQVYSEHLIGNDYNRDIRNLLLGKLVIPR